MSERVFRLDEFDSNFKFDSKFLDKFCSVLDLGLKFVPSIFSNLNSFFLYYLYELDKSLVRLNSYIYFEKQQKKNKKENKIKERNLKNTKKYENEKDDQTIVKTILKNIRYKNSNINHDNIPLQDETIIIRNNFFKSMSIANKFELKNNLTKDQLDCIKTFHFMQ